MKEEKLPLNKISVKEIVRLRCPHCGLTPLLKKGSWFETADGCPRCAYKFEREQGYFTGATWVLTYTVGAGAGLAIGALLLYLLPNLDSTLVAVIAACGAAIAAVVFNPYGKAVWLCLDHYLHPLEERERWAP